MHWTPPSASDAWTEDAVPPAPIRRSGRHWVGRALAALLALFVFWLFAIWPPPLWYRSHFPRETAFMAMRRHQDPSAAEHRKYHPIPLEQMAPSLRQAVLIGEDVRFYQHHGVDVIELRRALGYPRDSFAWHNPQDRRDLAHALTQALWHPTRVRGASTITQQLAKNLYLSPSRNPLRKLKEAITAWRLELWLSKHRILELYLNTVEMGDEVWGADAGSRTYFGVPPSRVDATQAATLAALLPFPRSSNPYYRPARMVWRRNLILERMTGRGYRSVPVDSAGR